MYVRADKKVGRGEGTTYYRKDKSKERKKKWDFQREEMLYIHVVFRQRNT